MTNGELIAEFSRRIDEIPEFALEVTLRLCRQILRERRRIADERAVLRDVKEFARIRISGQECYIKRLETVLKNARERSSTQESVEFRLRAKLEEEQAQVRRLEKERDELRGRITAAVNTLRDADEEEMHEQTWASVVAAIDTLEGKQCQNPAS